MPQEISADFGIAIHDGYEEIFRRSPRGGSSEPVEVTRSISMPGIDWEMRITPSSRFERDFYLVTNVTTASITAMTVLTAISAYFAVAFLLGRREVRQVELLRKARSDLERNQEKLRHLTTELSATEERFRRGIAEKIHDRVSNNLVLVKLRLGELARETDASTTEAIGEINSLITQAIDESRSMVYEISPPILFELGLAKAVEWYGSSTFAEHGLEFSLDRTSDLRPLRPDLAAALYRAFTELCVNVIKHSGASKVHAEVGEHEGHACIAVSDDGAGFEPTTEGGYGLFSIRERFTDIGGQLKISGSELGGARVFVCAPLDPPGRPS